MYARVFVVSWVTGGWESSDIGVGEQTWVLFNSSTDLTTEPSLESLSSNRVLILRLFIFLFFVHRQFACVYACAPRKHGMHRGQIWASDPLWTGVRQWAWGAGNQIRVLLKAVIHRSSLGLLRCAESSLVRKMTAVVTKCPGVTK